MLHVISQMNKTPKYSNSATINYYLAEFLCLRVGAHSYFSNVRLGYKLLNIRCRSLMRGRLRLTLLYLDPAMVGKSHFSEANSQISNNRASINRKLWDNNSRLQLYHHMTVMDLQRVKICNLHFTAYSNELKQMAAWREESVLNLMDDGKTFSVNVK